MIYYFTTTGKLRLNFGLKCSFCIFRAHPVNTKHLYNIYAILEQRRGRWAT